MKKFLGTALAAVLAVTSCFSVWAAEETPLELETETPYTLVKMEIPETVSTTATIRKNTTESGVLP